MNTVDDRPSDAPIENLATYGALVGFTESAGLIEASAARRLRSLRGPACTRVARRARQLREHLYAILAAIQVGRPVPQSPLDAIALDVRRAHSARALTSTERRGTFTHSWMSPASPETSLHACAWQLRICSCPPITAGFANVARSTARSTSSIPARLTGGAGAACKTAATGKNNGDGVQARRESASITARG